jgi:nickel/cobalt transporter (NicO) family protein
MTVSAFCIHVMHKTYTVAGAALIAVVLALATAPPAEAHPLGNFSVNHLSTVSVSAHRVDVRYVLDQAEIPTVQERGLSRAEVLRRKLDEIERGLTLTVNGRNAQLRPSGEPRLTFPTGAGGLATTRVELSVTAAVQNPEQVALTDNTFLGRLGWKAITAAPGEDTSVRTRTPTGDPTDALRRYPTDLLESPLDQREADFSVRPGSGTLLAPPEEGANPVETRSPGETGATNDVGGAEETGGATEPGGLRATGGTTHSDPASRGPRSAGFAGLFEDAAAGRGVLVVLLLAAFGWGALHALSPGHGKTMVAAYLIGTRGTARDAVVLGMTVTVTHTIGVFALGLVTLGLSQYVLPEQLYPWLTLISGLMVVLVGAGVLRSRLRRGSAHAGPHEHGDEHEHERAHGHPHRHGHAHGHGGDGHGHAPGRGRRLGTAGLLSMGAAAGLLPCPSALVVLLAAISQHEVALGMLLIVAFSLGLAGTLTALGIAVVHARRFVPPRIAASRIAVLLPALSALLVVALGLVLAARAVPQVM